MAKEINSAKILICQNATAGAGILGAFPLAAVVPSSPGWNMSDKHSRVAVLIFLFLCF